MLSLYVWHVAFGLEIKLDYRIRFIFKLTIFLGDKNERRGENSGGEPRVCHGGEVLGGVATDLD